MSQQLKTSLILDADGKAFITTVEKASSALDGLEKGAVSANTGVSKTRQGLTSISTQLKNTKKQLIGFFAVQEAADLIGNLVSTADSVKQMNARLLMATGSQQAFTAAQADAKRISSESRADYQSTVNLMSRLTTAAEQFGVSQDKISQTTEAVTYGLKLYGASAAEVSSVQTQLSQALASGTLAGDEFKSMAEASPRLMQALADGLGVARGELKKMASDGKLTTDVVINALAGQSAVLKEEFAGMPVTVGEAMGQVKNAIVQGIESFDAGTGITDKIAKAILAVSQNLGNIARAFAVAASASAAFYLSQKVSALTTAAAQMLNLGRSATATATGMKGARLASIRLNAALVASAVKMRVLNLVMMANPLGAIIGLVAAAISAFMLFKDKIHPVGDSIATLGDYAHVAFDYILKGIQWFFSPIENLTKAWDVVGTAIADLSQPAKDTFSAIGNFIGQLLGYVKSVVNHFIGFWVGAYKASVAIFKNFPAALSGIMTDAVNWALEKINGLVEGAANLLNYLPGVEIDVKGVGFKPLVNEAKSAAQSVYDAFSEGFNADYIGAAGSAINETFTAAANTVKAGIHEIGEAWTGQAEAYHRLNEETTTSATETAEALGGIPPKADGAGEAAKKAGEKAKTAGNAAEKAAKEAAAAQKQYADSLRSTIESLDPTVAAAREYADTSGLLATALAKGDLEQTRANELLGIAKQRYDEATGAASKYSDLMSLFPKAAKLDDINDKIRELVRLQGDETALEQLGKTAEEIKSLAKLYSDYQAAVESGNTAAVVGYEKQIEALKNVGKKAKDSGNVVEEQFKRAVESIDSSFAEMWKSVFSGGEMSFKSLKESFQNIMGEMMHSVTTQPLTEWLMDSVTGEVTQVTSDGTDGTSKGTKSILNSFSDGFDNLGKTFTKGIEKLFNVESTTAQLLGTSLAGGVVGAGVGGSLATVMGADNSGMVSMVSGLAGALASGVATAAGMGAAGATGLMALSATGVGAIVAAVAAIAMTLMSKSDDPTSRAWVRADGEVSHTVSDQIDGDITKSAGYQFWEGAKETAGIYGVQFNKELTAALTYKAEESGMAYYFDLFDDANLDGKRDSELYYHTALTGDDANDGEKIAQAMAQMQVAALKRADWSGVSDVVETAMGLVAPSSMSTDSVTAYFDWIDEVLLSEKLFSGAMGKITHTFDQFSGSLADYQGAVASSLALTQRFGDSVMDDVDSYISSLSYTDAERAELFADRMSTIDILYADKLSEFDEKYGEYQPGDDNYGFHRQAKERALDEIESWYANAIAAAHKAVDIYKVDAAAIVANFNLLTSGMELLQQATATTGVGLVELSQDVIDALGGSAKATEKFNNIFTLTASATHQAGIAYEQQKNRLDALNEALGFSGDRVITNTDQLYAWVSSLDPASDAYAEQISLASELATSLTDTATASKLFDDAISGINSTIEGVVGTITEDMMTDEELYNSRKAQAEALAASIAAMTDVEDIQAAAEEAASLVSNMWRSLAEEQQTDKVGDWMKTFLGELDTLAEGRITEIENLYGAGKEIADTYDEIEAAAIDMTAIAEAAKQQAAASAQQQQAGQQMSTAADNMGIVSKVMDKAATVISSAADKINKPVDVDVTVHQIATAGEVN